MTSHQHPQPLVDLDEVREAAEILSGVAVRTPLVGSRVGGEGRGLHLKLESLQPIGAFKIRGAYHAMHRAGREAVSRGVVAVSSGNHAQAVAWSARRLGVRASIVIPEVASPRKVAATEALGAEVVRVPASEREEASARLVAETGAVFIHPYDDRHVIAGQGTVGLEIAEDAPERIGCVLVPISGGGLISGVASALSALRPDVEVVGVEPDGAADAAESLHRGERTAWDPDRTARTSADGLRATSVGVLPWEHIRQRVSRILTVTDDQIAEAVRRLALDGGVVAEPSGAVSVAGWFAHHQDLPGGGVVAVVSGGNVEPSYLRGLF